MRSGRSSIVNPRASRLADPKRRDQIVKAATAAVAHRFGVAPLIEEGGIESTRAALAADPAPPLVVVMGGDGTVREAAAALLGREVPIADHPRRDRQRAGRRPRHRRRPVRSRRHPVRSSAAPGPRAGPAGARSPAVRRRRGRSPGTALHGRLRDGPRRTGDGRRRARMETTAQVRGVHRRRGPRVHAARAGAVPDRGRRRDDRDRRPPRARGERRTSWCPAGSARASRSIRPMAGSS